jgi:hypothetical protein
MFDKKMGKLMKLHTSCLIAMKYDSGRLSKLVNLIAVHVIFANWLVYVCVQAMQFKETVAWIGKHFWFKTVVSFGK